MAKSPIRVAVEAVLAEHDVYIGKDPTITDTSMKGGVPHSTRVKYPRAKVLTTSIALQIIRALALLPNMKGFKHYYVSMSNPKAGDCHGLVVGATNNDAVVHRLRSSGPLLINDLDVVGNVVIRNEDSTFVGYMDAEARVPYIHQAQAYQPPFFFVHPTWVVQRIGPLEVFTNARREARMKEFEETREAREAEREEAQKQGMIASTMSELKDKLESDIQQYKDLQIMMADGFSQPFMPEATKVRASMEAAMTALDVKWQAVGVYLNTLI